MKSENSEEHSHHGSKGGLLVMAIAALGVVFGDIGTSPLYAMNEIFFGHHRAEINTITALGAVSLAVWALTIIVAFKYVTYVLRADNQGEGGVFALLGLLQHNKKRIAQVLTGGLLILSAGLLFGDGLITPAISVLSAVEGLKVAAPSLGEYVVPITIVILSGLFAIQYMGTSKVGKFFGPIVSVWFIALALLGLRQVLATPAIFAAFNPVHAITFLREVGFKEAFFVLGSIMLVVTGGEALYADMGHFGKKPIRLSWFSMVYPALMLNYLGQGAYLLSGKTVVGENLFYSLVPQALLFPMIILATFATIIASQALISGVFSLTTQGIGLGLFPRLRVVHTHEEHEGQIYVPFINWALYVGCVILVIGFQSSTNLASAYGLAVAGDMLVTSVTMMVITTSLWHWPLIKAVGIFGVLALIDFSFLTANSLKFFGGGYVPLGIGLFMFTIMKSWQWGRNKVLATYHNASHMTMKELVARNRESTNYFPRSLVVLSPTFPTSEDDSIPGLMQLFLDRYGLMPKHLILLTVRMEKVPFVPDDKRYHVHMFENDGERGTIASVLASFGYMELPDVKGVLEYINAHPEILANEDLAKWIVFVGREQLLDNTARRRDRMKYLIFRFLHRNAQPAFAYFGFGEDLRLSTELVPVKI